MVATIIPRLEALRVKALHRKFIREAGLREHNRSVVTKPFSDRRAAGKALAEQVGEFAHRDDVVVLALPRGGVPVGYEIASKLKAPFDVLSVRKLGVPGHEELAMGAIASGGAYSLDTELIRHLDLTPQEMLAVARSEQRELERRERTYRDHRKFPDLENRTVILVDDGLATGQSMSVAVQAVQRRRARRIVVAVPVASSDACADLSGQADVICAMMPEPFYAVGAWYADFSQVTDDEVRELLAKSAAERESAT
ncbi:MAG TPA: phosphoribosyltransferase family protein [Candidatus Eremiobacteraceae bacterium]|nr:phosphoribosyltransferase family protein [Candidatus Eremiobacteraceae bacterium]